MSVSRHIHLPRKLGFFFFFFTMVHILLQEYPFDKVVLDASGGLSFYIAWMEIATANHGEQV